MQKVLHLYIAPAHNFFGHHGKPPGDAPTVEVDEIECVAGRGVRGDRFFDFKDNYKGQITFFAQETYEELIRTLHYNKPPSVFRRNVITAGIDLNAWMEGEFEVQGVRFRGMGECAPCYWMDHAFGPGAEEALKGRGGLRAVILSGGVLRVTRTLTAVLLAGGESRRMGREKATLMAGGAPLWARQVDVLRGLAPEAVVASARERPEWLVPEVLFVADAPNGRGPLGGIAAALGAMKTTHLLALAVDMPEMNAAHLAKLWGAAKIGRGVMPYIDGEAEPLAAIYPAEALAVATGLLKGEDVSMRNFAENLTTTGRMKRYEIGKADAPLYANWNKPADCQLELKSVCL